ncbi:MAG: sugar phosphate isomerase/epimerase family protein [Rhodoglobus sp.]
MENKICLNSNTYHGFDFTDAVRGARDAGIHFIEIAAVRGYTEHARWEMTDDEVEAMLATLRENDITILGMCGHTNIMTEDGRENLRKNLGLAARLGASYVVTGTGETHGDEHVIEDDTELVEILRELSAVAEGHGLTLAVETHGASYATGVQIKKLIGKVGAPNFKLNYDTANVIMYADTQPYDDLRESADVIVGIHLKDKAGESAEWNFPAIGDGDTDFARVFSILQETHCVAPLSIEIEFTSEGPASVDAVHDALVRSANVVRSLRGE